MKPLTGQTLGRYQLLEVVGQGGMATVYKALDPTQERHVAVKVLSSEWDQEYDFEILFRREANVVVQLRHEYIVPVEYFGEDDGFTYVVMPYHQSGTLADRLTEGPLTIPVAARVIDHIASALTYAHGRGVVHRDIKPSNILVDETGDARLTDFGLARVHSASSSITGSALLGTPAYISPEQARGEGVDHRSDQYSLGVILYQLVTGKLPFEGETPVAVLLQQLNAPMPSPRSSSLNVPESVERVILKSTAKDPEHRFASVSEMNEVFRAALAHTLNPKTNPEPKIELPPAADLTAIIDSPETAQLSQQRRRSRRVPIALLFLLLLLGAPVFASSLLNMLQPASGSAQSGRSSRAELSASQLTAMVGTIESMSTEISARGGSLPAGLVQTAMAQTLTAMNGFDEEDKPKSTPWVLEILSLVADLGADTLTPSPTSTMTATNTPTPSPTPTITGTPGPSPTPTLTKTPGPSPTPSMTSTPGPSPTPSISPASGTPSSPTASLTATPMTTIESSPSATVPPTSTPTRTPTRTLTKTTTRTLTRTPSKTPTRTPTLTPSWTSSPPPTSTSASLCSTASLSQFSTNGKLVSWRLSNNGSGVISITGIGFNWPGTNGQLKKVKLVKKTIWDIGDTTPPTTITSGWKGGKREVGSGGAKELIFEFSNAAQPGNTNYSLSLTLNGSCQISD